MGAGRRVAARAHRSPEAGRTPEEIREIEHAARGVQASRPPDPDGPGPLRPPVPPRPARPRHRPVRPRELGGHRPGLRPVRLAIAPLRAGAAVLLSRSSFQATAGATGYSAGDYLDHVVTADPASGAVLGIFWVNLSAGRSSLRRRLRATSARRRRCRSARPQHPHRRRSQPVSPRALDPWSSPYGTPVTAGRRVFIACAAAGTVRLKLSGGSTPEVPVAVGPNLIDDVAVVDVVAANTTATAVVSVLNRGRSMSSFFSSPAASARAAIPALARGVAQQPTAVITASE